MPNFKSLKWCFGIALSLGLGACSMDMQRSEQSNYPKSYEATNKTQTEKQAVTKPKAQQKTYASKDPTQPATPGPARKAAPQIPVIQ
ncbi:Uncharacterised protein [Legionella sainthelensi]|uniref:Uncharacterized protein n=1 Tax=Legionella sainthelensi TaxID=28087 RepID=A0A2H5FIR9_9GAMM|nr:hypothetical protein [Legionella sainthelensi]AUH71440.1 hypothetical protein CAB17_04700 [Legionella sainthelensi]VEB32376.1 Uncharacterised protein [Legionella sainthelensi]